MIKFDKFIKKIDQKINPSTFLFFDMDWTLIDTNYANFLSYKKAIELIIKSKIDISYNPKFRFNRNILKKLIPYLTELEWNKIIKQKEKYFKKYLSETNINELILEILIKYNETNKTVLVTNCHKERVFLTLDYHNLTKKFNYIFYKEIDNQKCKLNKYQNAITQLNVSTNSVIVFENEKKERTNALKIGVPITNIIIF